MIKKYSGFDQCVQSKENSEISEMSSILERRTPKEPRFSKLYFELKKGEDELRKQEK